MNRFTIGQAWSNAAGFFAGNAANFAIMLIGIGILVPLILQWVLVGNPMTSAFNPASLASGGAIMGGMGIGLLIGSIIGYVLQFGSYFASWRVGFGPDGKDLADGLRFGFIAAGVFVGLMILLFILIGILAFATTPWIIVPLALLLVVFFTIIYPALFGFFAIIFLLVGAFGGYALAGLAPMMGGDSGGGGIAILMFLFFGAFYLWLAARLCCTAPAMADKNDYLPFNAMKRSWALTAEGQWRIVGYFLLIGVVLFVIALILGLVVGSSFQSMLMGGGTPGVGMIVVLTVLVSIPVAYLTVAIPAGIYRTVAVQNAGEVFA